MDKKRKSYKEIPISRESKPQLTPEMVEDIRREWREKEAREALEKKQEKRTREAKEQVPFPTPTWIEGLQFPLWLVERIEKCRDERLARKAKEKEDKPEK
jgi:phenylpropionate dioxygenase-like ring-hydroxylating dioxygenase large terminal subunit